ncbi:hypothetical protein Tco_1092174 [Tanacetum coccineum]|uniref:Uncharacterized protein n=1 Tax=Tanacetum coccineum TaxID=301880 RepID=A0ABQ5IAA7_9ASTR
MSIRDQPPIPFLSEAEIDRLLAIPSPPPLPLSPFPTYPVGYRAAMIRLRAKTPSTSHPLPSSTPPSGTPPLLPLPTLSPPLLLPFTVYSAGVSEVTLPPWKRLCIALGLRYEVGESSSAPTARPIGGYREDYGFDEMIEGMPGELATDKRELGRRLIEFVTTVRQDTNEIYRRLDDAQDDRSLMSGRLNMLYRDRRAHARTARLMETEARLSREASSTTHSKVTALRTTVLAQQAEIAGLRAADRTRQVQLVETLTLIRTLQTQVTVLQTQQGLASFPAQPDVPEDAGSSSS